VRDFLHSSVASLLAKAKKQKGTDEQRESGLFFLGPPPTRSPQVILLACKSEEAKKLTSDASQDFSF
jgi:hypothetical protein